MKKETITAAAVLCALGTGFLACALHTDQPLSLGERRPLAQRPEVPVQTRSNGSFMSDFEAVCTGSVSAAGSDAPAESAGSVLSAAPEGQQWRVSGGRKPVQNRGGFERKQRAGGSREAQSPAGNVSGGHAGRFTVWCPIKIIIWLSPMVIPIWIMNGWMKLWLNTW